MAKTSLAADGTQLHDEWYLDYQLSDDETKAEFILQLKRNSWVQFYLGGTAETDVDTIESYVDDYGASVYDGYLDDSLNMRLDSDWAQASKTDWSWIGTGIELGVVTISRDLDSSADSTDFVIPADDSEWTLGWALCTTDWDSSTAADYTGVLTMTLPAGDGASYLAGLTVSGLAVLALMLSH